MKTLATPEQIDALLPQTQCQQCRYAGCRPYADALAANTADINRCPPGGVTTLLALAELLNRDPTPFLEEMTALQRPPQRAMIDESACIGCTKCLQVCPTDAIIGRDKRMHTVIAAACTGCELCLAPCPVDCITLVPTNPHEGAANQAQMNAWRERHQARQARLQTRPQRTPVTPSASFTSALSADERKAEIAAAVARAQQRQRTRDA